jgi:transposase InsO family protein
VITYYTLFVIDPRSRRVHVASSTPNSEAGFITRAARRLTDAVDGFLAGHRVLICDRDSKWTEEFRRIVEGVGLRVVLTPVQAPNANAYAERLVRSIRAGCLDRLILFGRAVIDQTGNREGLLKIASTPPP